MGRRGFRACLLAVGALVAGLAVPPIGGTVAARAAGGSADSPWRVAATLGLGAEETAASCPTANACWAIEAGQLVSSSDGGQTWTDETTLVPKGILALDELACGSATRCYLTAVGPGGTPMWLVLTKGGFTATSEAPGSQRLTTVSCAGPLHCMASNGKSVHVTHDGGASWVSSSLPAYVYANPALTCVAGTRTCWIVGDNGEMPVIEKTTDDGRSWVHQAAPVGLDGVYDVACPSVRSCHAVGGDVNDDAMIVGTSDGGAGWEVEDGPHDAYAFASVGCPTVRTCYAAGLAPASTPFVYTTTDSGASWQRQEVPADHLQDAPALACPSTSGCAAVAGGVAFWTTDSGSTWDDVDLPAAVSAPQSLSCASALDCVGVSNDAFGRPTALTSSDGGKHWSRHPVPAEVAQLTSVACPSASICYATSNGSEDLPTALVGHVLSSTDGGVTWTEGRLAGKAIYLRYLTCPSTTTCIAGGYDRHSSASLRLTTDGGRTWSQIPVPPNSFELGGISCASPTSCAVITTTLSGQTQAFTTSDLGRSYQPATINPDNYYIDLSCASTTCVAGGFDSGDGALSISRDGGRTWRDVRLPAGAQMVLTLSCSEKRVCAATAADFADGGGPMFLGTTDRGRTWHSSVMSNRHRNPLDLSCVAAACIASDVTHFGNPEILTGPA